MQFKYEISADSKRGWGYSFFNPRSQSTQKREGFKTEDEACLSLVRTMIEINPEMDFMLKDPKKYINGK
jgi:hypothetical protein